MSQNINNVFIESLKVLMTYTKTTGNRTAFAKAAGINQKTMWRMLEGDMTPTIKTVDSIANKLGFQAWELLRPGFKAKGKSTDKAEVENTRECCTPDECELLKIYRLTAPDHRKSIISHARLIKEEHPLPENVHHLTSNRQKKL